MTNPPFFGKEIGFSYSPNSFSYIAVVCTVYFGGVQPEGLPYVQRTWTAEESIPNTVHFVLIYLFIFNKAWFRLNEYFTELVFCCVNALLLQWQTTSERLGMGKNKPLNNGSPCFQLTNNCIIILWQSPVRVWPGTRVAHGISQEFSCSSIPFRPVSVDNHYTRIHILALKIYEIAFYHELQNDWAQNIYNCVIFFLTCIAKK